MLHRNAVCPRNTQIGLYCVHETLKRAHCFVDQIDWLPLPFVDIRLNALFTVVDKINFHPQKCCVVLQKI